MMDDRQFSEKLLARLLGEKQLLLTTHRNADADGLGAEIGLHYLMEQKGRDCLIVNQEDVNPKLTFVDPDKRVRNFETTDTRGFTDRTIVFLDNSDVDRAGPLSRFIQDDKSNWIVIDHHDGVNPDFHTFFQVPHIGSTSEIIYELFEVAGIVPPLHIAAALYTGIVVDTGHFKYGKTRARTHEIAAKLLAIGVNPAAIDEQLTEGFPAERLLLKKTLYAQMRMNEERNVAWFQVQRSYVEDLGLTYEDLEGLVNELIEPDPVKVGVIFTERESELTRVSVRSRRAYNMLPAVERFGGGGHKNACGATIELDLPGAVQEFIPLVTECLKNNS